MTIAQYLDLNGLVLREPSPSPLPGYAGVPFNVARDELLKERRIEKARDVICETVEYGVINRRDFYVREEFTFEMTSRWLDGHEVEVGLRDVFVRPFREQHVLVLNAFIAKAELVANRWGAWVDHAMGIMRRRDSLRDSVRWHLWPVPAHIGPVVSW